MTEDGGIESMVADTHVTASSDINSQGLTAADQRRIIVHYTAEMVHQVLSMPGTNPLGVVTTVELVEDASKGHPRIRVAATAPRYHATFVEM
jgi:hypothetical protein